MTLVELLGQGREKRHFRHLGEVTGIAFQLELGRLEGAADFLMAVPLALVLET